MKKQLLTMLLALSSVFWMEGYAQCTVLTGPLSENFDSQSGGSYTNADLPSCWEYYNTNTYPYAYVRNYSSYANTGSNALYWYRSSSSSYSGDTAAVMSPKFDLSGGNYEVKFYTRATSTSSYYNNVYYVGVCDSAGTSSSITVVDTFTISSTTYTEYTVDLTSTVGVGSGDSRVVFMMIGDGSTYGYALIDDIKIRVKSSCNDISNLERANILWRYPEKNRKDFAFPNSYNSIFFAWPFLHQGWIEDHDPSATSSVVSVFVNKSSSRWHLLGVLCLFVCLFVCLFCLQMTFPLEVSPRSPFAVMVLR